MANPFTPEQISQILEEFFKVVGTRQYIGARYVPIFGRKGEESIEWDNSAPYEPLTIVLYQGNSYTSRQYVPVGVEITNQEFWAITGNYNAQVEMYRQEVRNLLPYDETPTEDSTKAVTSDGIKKAIDTAVSVETTRAKDAEQINATAISNEVTRAKDAEKKNTDAISEETTRATTAENKLTEDLKKCIFSFDSIESLKNSDIDFKLNDYVQVQGLIYKITNDAANGMDIIAVSESKSITLQTYSYIKPEYLGYVHDTDTDAAVYINRALEIARGKDIVILSGEYKTNTTVHMSYRDCVYSSGNASIIASEYPIIAFDIDRPEAQYRNCIPFNGNSLIIMNKDKKVDDTDPTHKAVVFKNASEVTIKNLNIYYTGIAISIEDGNNYCVAFNNCLIERNYIGFKYNATTNSGERMSFDTVIFGHCYYAMYLQESISSLNCINCSFDFCSTGIYSTVAANDVFNFNGCHIEGMGYVGADMPKKDTPEYSIFIYNAADTQWTISEYSFISCVFHYSAMQDTIGIPLLVHNKYSTTYLNSCKNSVKKLATITKYPISTGKCPIGLYNSNVLQTGDKYLPLPPINGIYAAYESDNGPVKINKRNVSDALLDEIINNPYLIVNGESNHFFIEGSTEGDSYKIKFNNYYQYTLNDIGQVTLKTKLNSIKFNIGSNTVYTVNGIWFV